MFSFVCLSLPSFLPSYVSACRIAHTSSKGTMAQSSSVNKVLCIFLKEHIKLQDYSLCLSENRSSVSPSIKSPVQFIIQTINTAFLPLYQVYNSEKFRFKIPFCFMRFIKYTHRAVCVVILLVHGNKLTYKIKKPVFCDIAPCSLVYHYRLFKRGCCLHHQGDECPYDGGSRHL
jgi:hypothetical protein